MGNARGRENEPIAWTDLQHDARSLSRAAFAAARPRPALLLAAVPRAVGAAKDHTGGSTRERSIRRTLEATPGTGADRLDGRVLFVTKRTGNPFPNMVFVGRALNNDLALVLETVSKVHGYFRNAQDRWTFTDSASKNGSTLNGVPIVARVEAPLEDGDKLRIGLEIEATFLLPGSLHDRLCAKA